VARKTKPAKKPKLGELTSSQLVSYTFVGDTMYRRFPSGVTYQTYRDLRRDPTIAMARGLLGAAVLAAGWSIESDEDTPKDVVKLIDEDFMPIREQLVEAAIFGGVDYGWQGFEKVFEADGGAIRLAKMKPLLPDITTIKIDAATGAFAGYEQVRPDGQTVLLPLENCLHIAFRVEGTQWHGESLLENARAIQEKWDAADTSAANYDKKIAGSHFVVYYPPGVSMVGGQAKDNGEVASLILTALESSGSITVPKTVAEYIDQLNNVAASEMLAWKIEILQDAGGRQPSFVDRLKYLDTLKVRALLLPERAILEGQFGTKAEAGEHADMALTNIQLADQHITRHVNWYAVDQLLALNYGEGMRGKVRLVATPLLDAQLGFLRAVYRAILINPQGFVEEFGMIDTDALKDRLGLPKSKQIAQAGEDEDLAGVEDITLGLTTEQRARLRHFIPQLRPRIAAG